jgi:hypothetical protein
MSEQGIWQLHQKAAVAEELGLGALATEGNARTGLSGEY